MISWDTMVLVGRIARPHGNRGQVIVDPETDYPEQRFARGQVLYVRRNEGVEALTVTSLRMFRGRPIIGLEGVDSIGDAEGLARLEFRVPEDSLARLPDGTFYRHELVGCRVMTAAGAEVGRVASVDGPPDAGRLVVQGTSAEVLVPLVAEIVVELDTADRLIIIDPPDGLLDLNETGRARGARVHS